MRGSNMFGKFVPLLFLLASTQGASIKPPGSGGLGKNCYMSRQPKCALEREWIGCYKDNGYQRAFPELLLTARDNTSAVYFGENINWKDWENFIDRFTCACAQKAKQKYSNYFGIEYYGECWGGVRADYSVHGMSEECKSITGPDCSFRNCDEESNKPKTCVGGQWALYVYKIKLVHPPPPQQSTPPTPPAPQPYP
ncbi:uncharacterized protein LOC113677199 [Pocillopora damicornis]|uniref:uncharacterized protein LOC113677199 n=1 Tax=Pocillopora damicornis TaxID=46731 RepID=UPI000F5590CE|nr:uncharacterized protein LOC113677199 [Pocillopora damicornis]